MRVGSISPLLKLWGLAVGGSNKAWHRRGTAKGVFVRVGSISPLLKLWGLAVKGVFVRVGSISPLLKLWGLAVGGSNKAWRRCRTARCICRRKLPNFLPFATFFRLSWQSESVGVEPISP